MLLLLWLILALVVIVVVVVVVGTIQQTVLHRDPSPVVAVHLAIHAAEVRAQG